MGPEGPPHAERRKDHALRAAYNRISALEDETTELAREIAVLKEGAVTKGWLIGGILTISMAALAGAQSFKAGLEESAAKPLKAQAEKLDRFIEAQTATNIKAEATYLLTVERRPREEVREAVLRNTTNPEKPWKP